MNNKIILLVFLMAFLLAKTIKDRFDLPEPRIRRIEQPLCKPRKDIALACDTLNSGNVMTEENNTETANQ